MASELDNIFESEPLTLPVRVLDHGFVQLRNLAGPTRRPHARFDADSIDPARCARISFDAEAESRPRELDLKLNKYLLSHHHNTPIEMIEVWMEMKLPIFVARQFVRHRTATLNEVSARYVTLPEEWYLPKSEHVGFKAPNNKQGRIIPDSADEIPPAVHKFIFDLDTECTSSYTRYIEHLNAGIAPELARTFLHLNHYTHWIWKQDLWNMLHFLGKRLAPGAQFEAREYARTMQNLLIAEIPELMEAANEMLGGK